MNPLLELVLDIFLANRGPSWLKWVSAFFVVWSLIAAVLWLVG